MSIEQGSTLRSAAPTHGVNALARLASTIATAMFLIFVCAPVSAQTDMSYSRLVLAPLGDPSPDAVALAEAAADAVAACDGVVVCTGNASAGRERHDAGDNARAVGRRDACLAAVTAAGGTAVAAPLNLGAGEGEHGVLLTCAPSARDGTDGADGPPGPPGEDAVAMSEATPPAGEMAGDGAAAPSEEDGSGAAASEGSGEGSGEGTGESHGPRFEAGGTVLVTALGTTGGLELGVSGIRKVSPFARAQVAVGVFPGVWIGLTTGLELHLGEWRISGGATLAGDGLGGGATSLVQAGGLLGVEWSHNDHLYIRATAGPTWRWVTDGEAENAEPTGPDVQSMGTASVGWRF